MEHADRLKTQEMLLTLLPQWNYKITKPFKQLQDEGVSLEMYYCIKTLQWGGGEMTMSELGDYTKMPKQQMTKMVNRLVEQEFVERVCDPSDRRVIRIRLTDTAQSYLDHFIEHDASCFRPLLDDMGDEDALLFQQSLEQMIDVFSRLPCDHSKRTLHKGETGSEGKGDIN